LRLQSLEIKGFKSFADKTVIHFNENITGVVGPNGCGKSNIVDAIRWVLGEQRSSQLRSEKMENLIFNGTKKRRSSGLAQVSLTFENTKNILPTEYSTVTISRHYYRSGESEYRINGVPCRLKDITGLFMDTGIGSDSYAIIELGMVDDLLKDKDNSRRRLFEQAAGIEKYKKRKKETFNKLNATQGDLDRVEDLLFEIEGNLKSLERQARRTKRYYKLKEEYKAASIDLAVLMLSDRKSAFETINKRIAAAEDARNAVEARLRKVEAELAKAKAGNVKKEEALSAAQKALNAWNLEIQQNENKRNLLEEKLKNTLERIERLEGESRRNEKEIERLGEEIEKLKEKRDTRAGKVQDQKKILDSLKSELDREKEALENKASLLEQARLENRKLEKGLYEKEKQIAVNKAMLENLRQEIKKGEAQEAEGTSLLQELQEEQARLKKEEDALEKKLRQEEKQLQRLKEKLEENEKLLRQLRQKLAEESRVLDARQNEYKLTKNLVDSLEGFPESIKFLRKEVEATKKAPLLSDIISARKEYRAAIENYLEPYLNYYVVNTAEEAIQCVNILHDASKGRAHFFILDELDHYRPQSTIVLPELQSALDVLEVEEKYHTLAAFLLDHVYFAEEYRPEYAKAESESVAKSPVFITRNGRLTKGRFSVSGGALGLFEGKKLGRKKNLEKLGKEITRMEKAVESLSKKVRQLEESHEKLKTEINGSTVNEIREQLAAVRQKKASLDSSIQHYLDSVEQARGKSFDSESKIKAILKENEALESQLKSEKTRLEDILNKRKRHEEDFNRLNALVTERREAFNNQNIAFHQEENQLKSIGQEYGFKRDQLEKTRKNLNESKKELAELRERKTSLEKEVKETAAKLEKLYEERQLKEKAVRDAEENYYGSREVIQALDEEYLSLRKEKEGEEKTLNELKERMNELKLDLASLKERLSVEFNVELNDLLNREAPEDLDFDSLNERVNKVKHRLENYGDINPMAVEAFEEMKERFDFISSQRQDLLDARNNLLQTIREIDESAKSRFMESFARVQDNFQKVFRTLFTEDDDCSLQLLDPQNPLESKIEIIAKPKGKRPLSINQLSGGEKTLTAIALLFSLYLIKPAPFCVFDEVDAPLDDVNIGKFTNIIREFSKESQFILVTHNKQTMNEVDVIYGVTMVEEGVSRVVPVDFRSLN